MHASANVRVDYLQPTHQARRRRVRNDVSADRLLGILYHTKATVDARNHLVRKGKKEEYKK
jgi:hypothetical protein